MRKQTGKYILCVAAGIVLYLAAEFMDSGKISVERGVLKRNPTGEGDAAYEFYVEGLEEEKIPVLITVPEQKLTKEQTEKILPEAAALLKSRMRGDNESLDEVRSDLNLIKEIPEYGITVSWESENPGIVSSTGSVRREELPGDGLKVYLTAKLSNGICDESVEIAVTVLPEEKTLEERFMEVLSAAAEEKPEEPEIILPAEFEGRKLKYRDGGSGENMILIFLGILAAVFLSLKEKGDRETEKKKKEDSLIRDYPDVISSYLVLTGAGYPAKPAWKKMVDDYSGQKNRGYHPVYEEMQIALNQMDTGMPEVQAYREFGKRLGLRCYTKFASLLESSVQTGGKDMRRLLEAEMEEAFKQRTDLAKRKGEEAAGKLLFPMFLMLGVVMVIVVAPAFLALG